MRPKPFIFLILSFLVCFQAKADQKCQTNDTCPNQFCVWNINQDSSQCQPKDQAAEIHLVGYKDSLLHVISAAKVKRFNINQNSGYIWLLPDTYIFQIEDKSGTKQNFGTVTVKANQTQTFTKEQPLQCNEWTFLNADLYGDGAVWKDEWLDDSKQIKQCLEQNEPACVIVIGFDDITGYNPKAFDARVPGNRQAAGITRANARAQFVIAKLVELGIKNEQVKMGWSKVQQTQGRRGAIINFVPDCIEEVSGTPGRDGAHGEQGPPGPPGPSGPGIDTIDFSVMGFYALNTDFDTEVIYVPLQVAVGFDLNYDFTLNFGLQAGLRDFIWDNSALGDGIHIGLEIGRLRWNRLHSQVKLTFRSSEIDDYFDFHKMGVGGSIGLIFIPYRYDGLIFEINYEPWAYAETPVYRDQTPDYRFVHVVNLSIGWRLKGEEQQ